MRHSWRWRMQAAGDPTLIYGRWRPLDPGARPFGPFVNRNHFATWVLMACPLAAGYVATALECPKAIASPAREARRAARVAGHEHRCGSEWLAS